MADAVRYEMALQLILGWTHAYNGTQESLEVMRMEIQRILANAGITTEEAQA